MSLGNVVLVNAQDEPIGEMEKMDAHREGLLHRAFSVFIFNSHGQMLLQQRALGKYHSEGLWSNACCSHPRPGEEIQKAASRRLKEEIGLDCPLHFFFSFIYHINFGNGLLEHEYDHVFVGTCDDVPLINQEEAMSWKYMEADELCADMNSRPANYTAWFRLVSERVIETYCRS